MDGLQLPLATIAYGSYTFSGGLDFEGHTIRLHILHCGLTPISLGVWDVQVCV